MVPGAPARKNSPKGTTVISTVDKAIVSLVMAALFLLNRFAGIDLGISEATVTTIIAAATPVLVYLVPNKSPA